MGKFKYYTNSLHAYLKLRTVKPSNVAENTKFLRKHFLKIKTIIMCLFEVGCKYARLGQPNAIFSNSRYLIRQTAT